MTLIGEIALKPLCIYHGNCADGFGAAWAVRKALPEMDFHPGVYGDAPPDVTGRDVIMVDFSYKRAALDQMAQSAASILILDHHKTAQEDLAPFAIEQCGGARLAYADVPGLFSDLREIDRPPVVALFDMNRSGATMAWDCFHYGEARPPLLDHIEDRDLWLFKLEGTREIQANVFSFPYDFEVWDRLMDMPVEMLRAEGAAIERKHHKDIAELVAVMKRRMVIGAYDVPVANLPYTLTSDAGHLMAVKGEPFAGCYWDTPKGRVFSLRSTEDGIDVSGIAKSYGGGGHRNASGFTMPIGWEGDVPSPAAA